MPWDPSTQSQLEGSTHHARFMGLDEAGTGVDNGGRSSSCASAAAPARRQGPTASAATARPPAAKRAAGPVGVCVVRTIQDAEAFDFSGLQAAALPEAVRETVAEYRRRGGFQRVVPCPEDPGRYLNLFEAPRVSNVLYARWAAQAAARLVGSARPTDATSVG